MWQLWREGLYATVQYDNSSADSSSKSVSPWGDAFKEVRLFSHAMSIYRINAMREYPTCVSWLIIFSENVVRQISVLQQTKSTKDNKMYILYIVNQGLLLTTVLADKCKPKVHQTSLESNSAHKLGLILTFELLNYTLINDRPPVHDRKCRAITTQ